MQQHDALTGGLAFFNAAVREVLWPEVLFTFNSFRYAGMFAWLSQGRVNGGNNDCKFQRLCKIAVSSVHCCHMGRSTSSIEVAPQYHTYSST